MSRRPIIIDTDPGQDDAIAILAALASPEELEVLAVTSVAGNVPLRLTTKNALALVELAGRTDVPVYEGCARPMINSLVSAEDVHGPTGLDGADLPDPATNVAEGHAVDAIIDMLRVADDGAVTMCTLGPFTNVGMAMVKAPDIVPRIRELVLMGGGFSEGGNTTPAAEFNIYVDPHAAHVVFTSGVPLVMMPLDVTHKAVTSPARVQAFADRGSPAGNAWRACSTSTTASTWRNSAPWVHRSTTRVWSPTCWNRTSSQVAVASSRSRRRRDQPRE